jgi:hypothetical protein
VQERISAISHADITRAISLGENTYLFKRYGLNDRKDSILEGIDLDTRGGVQILVTARVERRSDSMWAT